MNTQDDFQVLRDERTKLVNRVADLETENARLREVMGDANRYVANLGWLLPDEIYDRPDIKAHLNLASNFLRQTKAV